MTDAAAESTDCYSVRMLSPYRGIFRGMLHIAELPGARAVTADGLTWRLQGRTTVSKSGWGSLDATQDRSRYVLYGGWSKHDGFHQAPLPPTCDVNALRQTSEPLIAALPHVSTQLPFEPRDRYELWLLDAQDAAPLALLASTTDEQSINTAVQPNWEPTVTSDTQFSAPSLLARGVENRSGAAHSHHRDILQRLVGRAAGRPARAQWFRRDADGSGLGLGGVGLDTELARRRLEALAFHPFLLRENWVDARDRGLVADFFDFMAPYLLTLNGLSITQRARLELAAARQATVVYRHYRLYPAVVDQSLLNRVLVEAVMRRSAETRV